MEAGQEDKHAGTQHGANELSIRAHAEQAERRGGALPHGPGGEHSSHHQDLSAGSVGSFLPASVDASRRLSRFGVGAREQNGELLSEEKSKPAPQPNQRKGPEEEDAPKKRKGRVSRRHMKSNANLVTTTRPPAPLPLCELLSRPGLLSLSTGLQASPVNVVPGWSLPRFFVPPQSGAGVFTSSGYTSFHGPDVEHFPPCDVPLILNGSLLPNSIAVRITQERERSSQAEGPVSHPGPPNSKPPPRPSWRPLPWHVPTEHHSAPKPASPQPASAQSAASESRLPLHPLPAAPSLGVEESNGGVRGGCTVPQRLLQLMRFGKERLLLEIRSHQLLPDEDEEQERPRYRWQRKQRKTRGPLSEGNRPRSIWALEDVQSLMVEILGVAGLNLFDEEGQLMKERKHGQTYKTLQNMLGKDGRDLIETLLRLSHADNKWVVKLEEKAGEGEHFLRADSVARQLVRFMDRLLDHMEVLREEPQREPGDWRVQLSESDKDFIRSRLGELTEHVAAEDRRYPTQEVKYTHFDAFVKRHRERLPTNITAAYLKMYVMTLVDQELPLEVWAENTLKCKIALDKAAGRNGRDLPPGWDYPTPEQLANIVRLFFKCQHPLRRQDRRLRFAMAAANEFCRHFGLSVASIDKILDGPGSAGYRIYLPKYREYMARYAADPDAFYLTFTMAQHLGNLQLTILFDNLAKAEADFRLYAAYMVEVGQFVPELYARYFEFPNLEAAQEDVDERMAASRKAVEGNADDSMGDNSWFARQMKDRKGDRVRAKGRQLRDHVTLEHVKQIHAFQRHSCHYSGETVFLARGGKYSPHAGCVELVSATSRAAKIAGSWLARGFNRAPLEARFAFLEYWGMDGRRYLAYLKPTGRGSFDDPLEAKSLEILGQDRSGNLLAQNSEGEGGQSLSGEETSGARSREEEAGGPAKLEEPAGELRRAVSALPSVPPLPFGGLHGSWGTIGGCLDELTAEKPPPSPRYRRRGLTIDGAPRALTSLRNSHSTRARDDADLPGADSNLSGRGLEVAGTAPCPSRISGGSSRNFQCPLAAPSLAEFPAPEEMSALLQAIPTSDTAGQGTNGGAPLPVDAEPESVVQASPDLMAASESGVEHRSVRSPAQTTRDKAIIEPGFMGTTRQNADTLVLTDGDDSDTDVSCQADGRYPGLPAFLPARAPRRVYIGPDQMDKLRPGEWLCTQLVDFYSLYLESSIQNEGVLCTHPGLFDKLHRLFRCASLMSQETLERDFEKAIKNFAIPGVEQLFKCRALFVPIHFRSHFTLAVVMSPGSQGAFAVHLDSLSGFHAEHVEKLVRKFLSCALAISEPSINVHKGGILPRFSPSEFPFVAAKVPQQPNNADCALFMLHNLELLLADLSLADALRLNADASGLYEPSVAVSKREELRALILSLVAAPNPVTDRQGESAGLVLTLSPGRRRVVPSPSPEDLCGASVPGPGKEAAACRKRSPPAELATCEPADAAEAPNPGSSSGKTLMATGGTRAKATSSSLKALSAYHPFPKRKRFNSPAIASKPQR